MCVILHFKSKTFFWLDFKRRWSLPKNLITQNSQSLVCLAVYNQYFHIGLKKKKGEILKTTWNHHNNIPKKWVRSHEDAGKTYMNRVTLIFEPLLRVKVQDLPAWQKGFVDVQGHVLQTGQFCTLDEVRGIWHWGLWVVVVGKLHSVVVIHVGFQSHRSWLVSHEWS